MYTQNEEIQVPAPQPAFELKTDINLKINLKLLFPASFLVFSVLNFLYFVFIESYKDYIGSKIYLDLTLIMLGLVYYYIVKQDKSTRLSLVKKTFLHCFIFAVLQMMPLVFADSLLQEPGFAGGLASALFILAGIPFFFVLSVIAAVFYEYSIRKPSRWKNNTIFIFSVLYAIYPLILILIL